MRTYATLSLGLLMIAFYSYSKSKMPETLVCGGYDQQEMDAAIARARSEVDSFIVELSHGNGTEFAVKAPIEDNGTTEHFWLTDIKYRNGEFHGFIDNDPGLVRNVEYGQQWTINKSEISDWMFTRDGKVHGNYTVRPLLRTMSEEDAAEIRSQFADP